MSRTYLKLAVALAVILVLAVAGQALAAQGGGKPDSPGGGGGGGGKPHDEQGNNLSFPVIAADGTVIPALAAASWATVYDGPYDGLTAEELAIATNGVWYAQKVEGNKWQGGYYNASADEPVAVHGMDWGDNIQSVSPTINRPYRLEAALFAETPADLDSGTVPEGNNAYAMVMLAFPSSPNEVQGTNAGNTYTSLYTTITSKLPGLRIQRIEDFDASTLEWDVASSLWIGSGGVPPNTVITFAPELNVGGKYIFGGSTGGWRPSALGTYRLTFYIPEASQIEMDETTTIGNLVNGAWVPAGTPGAIVIASEGTLATPVLRSDLNLSYVDVTVVQKGGRQ